jgi:CRISPR system Cascade subunit CasD
MLLDAPLQSWGVDSRFDHRATSSFPSRSALSGILAAALGVPKNDLSALESLNALRLDVVLFKGSAGLLLSDYHTVGGGHSKAGFMPVSADRGDKTKTVVTSREYLQDSVFGAVWSGDSALIRRCEAALANPVWGVWLGRKSCAPASPLGRGVFPSFEKALEALERGNAWRGLPLKAFRLYSDAASPGESSAASMDLPVDFLNRKFRLRGISESSLE